MSKKIDFLSVILSAVLITFLFYKQAFGINLVVFEVFLFAWLAYQKKLHFKTTNQILLTLGTLASLLATVFVYSDFSYIWHFVSLLFFIGMTMYPTVRSLFNLFGISMIATAGAQLEFIGLCKKVKIGGSSIGKGLGKLRFFFIPVFIIFVFIGIYSTANPVFNSFVGDVFAQIGSAWSLVFYDFEFAVVMTFILGIVISNFLLIGSPIKEIIEDDENASEYYKRKRKKQFKNFAFFALKNELRAAVFLFVSLNIILAIVNGIDVYWVWFNFEWEGQYLKQFVHSGTYLLILSILFSIGLVLYFFRGNLNFYKKNIFLKKLSYLWLAQNALLAISVGIRNYWYVEYYALAYKRIGVFIFLLLTLYGLYTIYNKLKENRSYFYFIRNNAFVFYTVITLSSVVDWDGLITRYNFAHANKSFLHLNFLANMSDKTLPDMDKSLTTLQSIQLDQQEEGFLRNRVNRYLSPEEYYDRILKRKKEFKIKWESKGFLSWNYPEYKAYQEMYFEE